MIVLIFTERRLKKAFVLKALKGDVCWLYNIEKFIKIQNDETTEKGISTTVDHQKDESF